jgi:hypothetical protein
VRGPKLRSVGKMTLGELIDQLTSVEREIRAFYRDVGLRLRELDAYKRKHGICTCGISCAKMAVGRSGGKGTRLWCDDHDPERKGRRSIFPRFVTPYGLKILAAREAERMRKGTRGKNQRPKRALKAA